MRDLQSRTVRCYDPGSNVAEVYISHLRRKLGEDAIETVRGMGYRLRE